MAVLYTDLESCDSQTSPLQFHPFSTIPKSTPMNRRFPPELIQLIVEASLDPYDFFTASDDVFPTRYAILR